MAMDIGSVGVKGIVGLEGMQPRLQITGGAEVVGVLVR